MNTKISVEVVFATESKQQIIQLALPVNSTARYAVDETDLKSEFPEFNFDQAPLGIFGKKVPDNYLLSDQDRVEVYRPLVQSPQEARRQRVQSTKNHPTKK